MFKSYKKFVIYSLLIPLPFILFLGVLLYVYDPLQLYHEPWFRKKTYHDNLTISAKGIVDYNLFDSLILGSSMLQNTSSSEASSKLGGQFINLSIGGSTFNQRKIILDYILKNKQIKRIIYSLDGYNINLKMQSRMTNDFNFLYDNSNLNDFKIYINTRFILCALTFSLKSKCIGKSSDMENFVKWGYKNDQRELFGGLHKWFNGIQHRHIREALVGIIKSDFDKTVFYKKDHVTLSYNFRYFHDNLVDVVRVYPNVEFNFIIPTYSRAFYKMRGYSNYFKQNSKLYLYNYINTIKWFIATTHKYPNVKIYGFDNLDYADNLSNYNDPVHYDIDMNSMQLDAIKNQTNILTPENMDEYFKIMEEKIKNYDLNPLIEQIKASGILDK